MLSHELWQMNYEINEWLKFLENKPGLVSLKSILSAAFRMKKLTVRYLLSYLNYLMLSKKHLGAFHYFFDIR